MSRVIRLAIAAIIAVFAIGKTNGPAALGQGFQVLGAPISSPEEMELFSNIEIEVMQGVARLDADQVAQLKQAAAAAARNIFSNPEKYCLPAAAVPALPQVEPAIGDKGTLSDEDAEAHASDVPVAPQRTEKPQAVFQSLLDHEIWKHAKESILTADQQAALKEYAVTRRQLVRRSTATNAVNLIDEAFVLSPDQREKLYQAIVDLNGDNLTQIPLGMIALIVSPDQMSTKEYQGVLSPGQLAAGMTDAFLFTHMGRLLRLHANESFPPEFDLGHCTATVKEMDVAMVLYVDAMRRTAQLDESQVAKLQQAASVAAKEMFGNPDKYAAPRLSVNPEAKAADAGPASVNDPDAQAIVPVGMLIEHPTWKGALSEVLTDQQQAAIDKFWHERRAAKRQSLVNKVVDSLDNILTFSESQRSDTAAVVNKLLGARHWRLGYTATHGTLPGMSPRLSAKDFAGVWSPAQGARYSLSIAPQSP